jgi:hypothetical protein
VNISFLGLRRVDFGVIIFGNIKGKPLETDQTYASKLEKGRDLWL